MGNKPIRIRLLRDQIYLTGGVIYEENLIESLEEQFIVGNVFVIKDKKIFSKKRNVLRQILLIIYGFYFSNANVNIVTAKLALSSIIRNLFSKNRTIIVLHNFDVNDKKRRLLKLYYSLLFKILSLHPPGVAIVCVSPFFLSFFQNKFKKLPVFLIPNLFENEKYRYKPVIKDPKKILLGQYSPKIDGSIFKLAKDLDEAGYHPFFLSLIPKLSGIREHFEIRYIPFEEYLKEMASSYCTIAFTRVNEGWNRIVHESILVGTPVIGYARGGLGDLLRESDSYIVNTAEEAFNLIVNQKLECRATEAFIQHYNRSNSAKNLAPLMQFILKNVKENATVL